MDNKTKLKKIKMLKIVRYLPFLMILIPILIYKIMLDFLFYDRESLDNESFDFLLKFNSFLFVILLIYCIISSIVLYKNFNKQIELLKKAGSWNNYSEQFSHFQPIFVTLSFWPLFSGSLGLLEFITSWNIHHIFEFIIYMIIFIFFILCIYFFVKLKNKYINYESIDLGKIKFEDSKNSIEKIFDNLELKYRKLGPRKGISLKSDETYLINEKFELLIASTVKEDLSKFWWPENSRSTAVIIGKIDGENRKTVKKIQKEIDKLKINE